MISDGRYILSAVLVDQAVNMAERCGVDTQPHRIRAGWPARSCSIEYAKKIIARLEPEKIRLDETGIAKALSGGVPEWVFYWNMPTSFRKKHRALNDPKTSREEMIPLLAAGMAYNIDRYLDDA